jgi:hypothetical protein
MCREALDAVNAHPEMQEGVRRFLAEDLAPTLERHDARLASLLGEPH